jgi:hypothetical protein
MKILRGVAKPCGIAGGVWAILLAIVLSVIAPIRMVTAPGQYVSNTI